MELEPISKCYNCGSVVVIDKITGGILPCRNCLENLAKKIGAMDMFAFGHQAGYIKAKEELSPADFYKEIEDAKRNGYRMGYDKGFESGCEIRDKYGF